MRYFIVPRALYWCCVLLFVGICGAACQQGEPNQALPVTGSDWRDPAYVRDMDRICFCEERSGALAYPEGQRRVYVAQWLGSRLETETAHSFLVRLVQAEASEKVALLDQEAIRLGLPECPLARTWARDGANSR